MTFPILPNVLWAANLARKWISSYRVTWSPYHQYMVHRVCYQSKWYRQNLWFPSYWVASNRVLTSLLWFRKRSGHRSIKSEITLKAIEQHSGSWFEEMVEAGCSVVSSIVQFLSQFCKLCVSSIFIVHQQSFQYQSCLSVHWGSHVIITHYALDLTLEGPPVPAPRG